MHAWLTTRGLIVDSLRQVLQRRSMPTCSFWVFLPLYYLVSRCQSDPMLKSWCCCDQFGFLPILSPLPAATRVLPCQHESLRVEKVHRDSHHYPLTIQSPLVAVSPCVPFRRGGTRPLCGRPFPRRSESSERWHMEQGSPCALDTVRCASRVSPLVGQERWDQKGCERVFRRWKGNMDWKKTRTSTYRCT